LRQISAASCRTCFPERLSRKCWVRQPHPRWTAY
jgi:hypothetical protein